MADEIASYAQHAQRKEDLNEALSAIPATPLVGPVASHEGRRRANPVPSATAGLTFAQTQMRAAVGAGPVQSVPKIADRLFGRRKVI